MIQAPAAPTSDSPTPDGTSPIVDPIGAKAKQELTVRIPAGATVAGG